MLHRVAASIRACHHDGGTIVRSGESIRRIIPALLAATSTVCGASHAAAADTPAFKQAPLPAPAPLLLLSGSEGRADLVQGEFSIGNLGDELNDRITGYLVPQGYVMALYADTQFRGTSALVYGGGKVIGELAGEVSSVKVRPYNAADCAIAYEHAYQGGEAWPFCRIDGAWVLTDADAWQDKISSVEVPRGLRLSFCTDDYRKPCRGYFGNSDYIGHASNDSFRMVYITTFDDTRFRMVFMSDPQFGWDGTKPDELAKYSDRFSSWEAAAKAQSLSMLMLRGLYLDPSFAGVVVNGDMTNTAEESQIDKFSEVFGQKFDNIYPGLGNHDIDNYVTSGDNKDILQWYDEHVSGSPGLVGYDFDGDLDRDGSRAFYRGSLAYSWDIGDVHFVQLNNYPSFELKGDWTVDIDIRKSLDWLENDLKTVGKGKRVIINMHTLDAAGFSSAGCEQPCAPGTESLTESKRSSNTVADYRRFQSILMDARANHAKDRTVVVFGGHIHWWAGFDRAYKAMGTPTPRPKTRKTASDPNADETFDDYVVAGVPMLFTGGAQYSLHLHLEFEPGIIRVKTIDSSNYNANVVDTVEITSGGTVTRR